MSDNKEETWETTNNYFFTMEPKSKKKAKPTDLAASEKKEGKTSAFGRPEYNYDIPEYWRDIPGVGWVYIAEEKEMLLDKFFHCFLTKKWVPVEGNSKLKITPNIVDIVCFGQYAYASSSAVDKDDKWVKSIFGPFAFRKSTASEALDANDKAVLVSPSEYDVNTAECALDGKRYLKSAMVNALIENVLGKPFAMRLVATKNIEKTHTSCPNCSTWAPKACIKYHKVTSFKCCPLCLKKALKESGIIQAWNGTKYPAKIWPEDTRFGAVLDNDGRWVASGSKEAIQGLRAKRIFGIELEVEFSKPTLHKRGLDRYDMAIGITSALGDSHIAIKEDGSLLLNGKYDGSNGHDGPFYAGFEIVSCPASLEAHRGIWSGFDKFDNFDALRSWDTHTCAMHVHVNRESTTNLQVGKLLVLINHPSNAPYIQKIAGRKAQKYSVYSPRKFSDAIHPERVISPSEDSGHNKARRVALNLHHPGTVEFRIFRGTVRVRHILRNLEFCDAALDFTHPNVTSLQDMMDFGKFIAFVGTQKKKWPLLAEWMAHPDRKWLEYREPNYEKAKLELLTIKPSMVVENEEKGDSAWVESNAI